MPRFLIISSARSGSTLLCSLLRCHPLVAVEGELFNDENPETTIGTSRVALLKHAEGELTKFAFEHSKPDKQAFVGFRVTPEQLTLHKLRLDHLVRSLGISKIIVLWREHALETYVSLNIATLTNVWYTEEEPTRTAINLNPNEYWEFYDKSKTEWAEIAKQWPIEIPPVYISYEQLVANREAVISELLFTYLQCNVISDIEFTTAMKRQNPSKVEDKVSNWGEVGQVVSKAGKITIAVPQIFETAIEELLHIPRDKVHLVPSREPPCHPSGWQYRVAEPYLPKMAKSNVMDAIDSGFVSSAGYWVDQMGKRLREIFTPMTVAQPCNNGFTSLVLALQAADVHSGDEVICPTFTMIAVPNAISFVGGTPVFVDNSSTDYNPSVDVILAAATPRTKAVIVSHTYGVPMREIEVLAERCKERGWRLIEDISECVGIKVRDANGTVRYLGTFGDFACASMYANKIVHAGDGGFVLARDPSTATRLLSLVNHGFTRSYHFVHFERAINAKINGLGAALACGCLDDIDNILEHRSTVTALYRKLLSSLSPHTVEFMPTCGAFDTAWVFGFVCKSREVKYSLRRHLALRYGIETRNYFFAMHLQPSYQTQIINAEFPNAEYICNTGVYLPTHTNLTNLDVEYICQAVLEFFNSNPSDIDSICVHTRVLPDMASIRIDTNTLKVSAHVFDPRNPAKKVVYSQDHVLVQAVKLYQLCERFLSFERRDVGQELLTEISACVDKANANGYHFVEVVFQPFVDYIKSQESFEPSPEAPWTLEEEDGAVSQKCRNIPTTTDSETRQLLVWLVKHYDCHNILELGSWFGHVTKLLAETAAPPSKVFAVDQFVWETWMGRFMHLADDSAINRDEIQRLGFFDVFKRLSNRSDIIPVQVADNNWEPMTKALKQEKCKTLDLVYIDFAQEASLVEIAWNAVLPFLEPGKTIIVINSLSASLLPFIVKYSANLLPIAKPIAIAKAFLYQQPPPVSDLEADNFMAFEPKDFVRRLKFVEMPGWTHHHQNAFETAIQYLHDKYHDDDAPVLFIPAVDQYLAGEWSKLNQRWIGIIHGVPDYPEEFYVPDLRRFCTMPEYLPCLELCLGLYTLTQMQADFLRANLPKHLQILVQSLKLPGIDPVASFLENKRETYHLTNVALIGEFARDVDFFYKVQLPSGYQKVMLVSGEEMESWAKQAPSNIKCIERLASNEYEAFLANSIVMLPLKYDGAANTVIVECILRNVPILISKGQVAIEYLGKDYPLMYDAEALQKDSYDLSDLLTTKRIALSIDYLKSLDKSIFSIDNFLNRFQSGAVLLSVPPPALEDRKHRYDVTICICSYKRTANLGNILRQIWSGQTSFSGRIEIIVWNNNDARAGEVCAICQPYLKRNTASRSLQLIESSKNHYCMIRLAVCHLMQSDELLICDDDIVPGPNFVQFFTDARKYHRRDVLCLRGAKFQPHSFNVDNPMGDAWYSYNYVRFVNDDAPEQPIHFAHMDVCLIGKEALLECNSHAPVDPDFALVDDYWISYILNHYHGRTIRKLRSTASDGVAQRTESANSQGLALHTRPEVRDARVRFYIHHMLNGWPKWESQNVLPQTSIDEEAVKLAKRAKWFDADKPFIGFNVSSRLSREDAEQLSKWGVRYVRIGTVGCKEENRFELSGFLTNPELQLDMLKSAITMLASFGINVVLTLTDRLASPKLWRMIAQELCHFENVIGYDLINEAHTEWETTQHWHDTENAELVLADEEGKRQLNELTETFKTMMRAKRECDRATPIIVEASFWASIYAVQYVDIDSLLSADENFIIRFFYGSFLDTKFEQSKHVVYLRFLF